MGFLAVDYMKMAFFPYESTRGKLSGGLAESLIDKPSADGVKVNFNGNPDLDEVLSKVENAGGKITMPKGQISEDIGYMAFFTGAEGNTVALHSQK